MAFALITGASSGLGAEFARLFARDSYDLILVARRKNRLEEISRALKAMHPGITIVLIEQDLGKAGATHSLWEKVKSYEIEALVNNAGFGNSGAFGSSSLEKEVELIELNIRALVEQIGRAHV